MGTRMTLHPRHAIVTKAEIDMKQAACAVISRHPHITHAELMGIFISIMASWNKYAVRDEREPHALGKTGANT